MKVSNEIRKCESLAAAQQQHICKLGISYETILQMANE